MDSDRTPPTQAEVRTALAELGAREQRIVAGLLAMMMREPARVRDREWMAEHLAQVAVLGGELEADTPQDGVRSVQEYLVANARTLLGSAILLFQRVGLDLEPRAAAGFSFEEALACGLSYLPAGSVESLSRPANRKRGRRGRELGEQPLARRMAERGLAPADLVTASEEQLTYKMVRRAMKGRRLTARAMAKVQRAWNRAAAEQHAASDLFDYEP